MVKAGIVNERILRLLREKDERVKKAIMVVNPQSDIANVKVTRGQSKHPMPQKFPADGSRESPSNRTNCKPRPSVLAATPCTPNPGLGSNTLHP